MAYWSPLHMLCELQCIALFYNNTDVFVNPYFGVRQTELLFQHKFNLHGTDVNNLTFIAALPAGILSHWPSPPIPMKNDVL